MSSIHSTVSEWQALIALCSDLGDRLPLEQMLRRIVDTAALLINTERVGVRLLDPSRTQLIAACRAGKPLHMNPVAFALGEGLVGWIADARQSLRTGDAERDPRFAIRPGIQEPLGSFLGVPLVAGRSCMGVLSASSARRDRFTAHDEELLTLLAGICAPHVEMARLDELSRTDPLTGTFNRRGLEMAFPDDGMPLSVVMLDIDHFKQVNDDYGHAIGDAALKRVAQILVDGLRAGDAVIRWGGEEFLLVLPRVALDDAARIAERARVTVEATMVEAAGLELSVTLSAGVAERDGDETRDQLIERADAAMYAAKRAGRNRVTRADRRNVRAAES